MRRRDGRECVCVEEPEKMKEKKFKARMKKNERKRAERMKCLSSLLPDSFTRVHSLPHLLLLVVNPCLPLQFLLPLLVFFYLCLTHSCLQGIQTCRLRGAGAPVAADDETTTMRSRTCMQFGGCRRGRDAWMRAGHRRHL